jgi:hypothetical protein
MLAPWIVAMLLITLRDLGVNLPGTNWKGQAHKVGALPAPADYLATFAIFTPLAFLEDSSSQGAQTLAKLIGWGWDLSIFFGAIDVANPLSKAPATPAVTATPTGGQKAAVA